MISGVLGLFVNTLSPDDKYALDNIPQRIQMQFSKNPKNFYQLLAAFLKSTSNFQHIFKEAPFDSQHVKGSQTLLKSARQKFYHIFHHSKKTSVEKCLS